MSFKDIIINFLISFLAIFMGMLFTFLGQGMIDKAADKKEVRSALELVRSELADNIDDIGLMKDYLKQERKSAEYFLAHRTTIDKCPADSIAEHTGIIFADATITLSHDALELLKSSSLFPKIGNSDLSMKIIHAYDTCESIADLLNGHISLRSAQYDRAIDTKTIQQIAPNGSIDIKKFVKTGYGLYTLRWLTTQPAPEYYTDVTDVQDAITAIDNFLKGRIRLHRK